MIPIAPDGFPVVCQDCDGTGNLISFLGMPEVLNCDSANDLHLLLAVIRDDLPVLHFQSSYITNLNMNCLHLPERSPRQA